MGKRGSITSVTHQYFRMEDFDSNPSRILVEMNYLMEMFEIERISEIGKPVVVTLRERPDHFGKREERRSA